MTASDKELVAGLLAGSELAVEALVGRYQERIYAYLYRMTGDSFLAEDLTQETFVRALDSLPRLRDGNKLKNWLYRIAGNLARDHFKKAQTREIPSEELDEHENTVRVSRIIERQEASGAVRRALRELKPEQREALILRFYEELPILEIAEIMGVPPGTIKSRIHYALKILGGYWSLKGWKGGEVDAEGIVERDSAGTGVE